MIFVDTNYFLRYLRDDVPEQSKIAKKLFIEAANGKKNIFTSLIVFFEVFWVVSRSYVYDKSEVIRILRGILAMNFIAFPDRDILTNTIGLFESTTLEFEDCYNIAYSEKVEAKEFLTFDRKLGNFLKKKIIIKPFPPR
jgi:predicted nucleic-acid-binding protein